MVNMFGSLCVVVASLVCIIAGSEGLHRVASDLLELEADADGAMGVARQER